LFPEFGAELPLNNCTPTGILNNPAHIVTAVLRRRKFKENETKRQISQVMNVFDDR
jgi:hypothetical protein